MWYNQSPYAQRSEASQVHVTRDERWLTACWEVGNDFRNRNPLYGTYPPGVLERLLLLFKDMRAEDTLHLFSGALGPGLGTRYDIDPAKGPDVCGGAEELAEKLSPAVFRLCIADPPYSRTDAERYGFEYPNKRLVMHALAKVIVPGGFVAWLDTAPPIYSSREWRRFGTINIVLGTNKRIRNWFLFERVGVGTDAESY